MYVFIQFYTISLCLDPETSIFPGPDPTHSHLSFQHFKKVRTSSSDPVFMFDWMQMMRLECYGNSCVLYLNLGFLEHDLIGEIFSYWVVETIVCVENFFPRFFALRLMKSSFHLPNQSSFGWRCFFLPRNLIYVGLISILRIEEILCGLNIFMGLYWSMGCV